jgi:ribosomal protein S18 acetylase RimI-like enzyme
MKIRNYESSDCAEVVELWDAVFPNSTGHNDPKASIGRKVAADDGLFFVAVDGDSIVGTVLAGYDGHRGWLYSVAVAPNRRRDGIGSQLIRHAEQALAQRGCPKLNIQVRADNAAVVAFYESLGFQTEERISMGKLIEE